MKTSSADLSNFSEAMVGLANALDEWKSAGADSLSVVGAIQRFVYAIHKDLSESSSNDSSEQSK